MALYSDEDPEETLTVGGVVKLKMVDEPYPIPGRSTLIEVILPLTIGFTTA